MSRFFLKLSYIVFSFVLAFFLAGQVKAYPPDQLNECVVAAKSNPSIEGVPLISIEAFCDCALSAIVDKGFDEKDSANKCATSSFND